MGQPFKTSELKRYSLEVYGPGGADDLVWKVDSDDPFTPMNRGDRMMLLDAPGARPDAAHEITGIEHLIWTAGEQLRYVTRIHTRPADPLG
ncbi:hypothetical protein [Phenylobacterium sp.]|jgi:hypothetical protein|uniref:hypothetical protein n=1 Tax=Phenylobacterium sp. TaxID=1871053 RepID=UPI002F93792E